MALQDNEGWRIIPREEEGTTSDRSLSCELSRHRQWIYIYGKTQRRRLEDHENEIMDTLEHRMTYNGHYGWQIDSPILWKGKTAKEVQRQEYPDYHISSQKEPPKSTRNGVDYCRQFTVKRHGENDMIMPEAGDTIATLTEIDR